MKKEQSLETKLAILQQGEYEWRHYEEWCRTHSQQQLVVAPKKMTLKLSLLQRIASVLGILVGEDQALRFGLLLLGVPQWLITQWILITAKWKLRRLQKHGLKVIAVVGSYAKTSTKHTLAHVLSGAYVVHSTPGNINRALGIAKEIKESLNATHQFFVVEMGEYDRGDIAAMTSFVAPSYAVITPITIAHLERFSSQEEIETEIFDVLRSSKATGIVHQSNHAIAKQQKLEDRCQFYDPQVISQVTVSRAGTEFFVPSFFAEPVFISLFGRHNAENTLPAMVLATSVSMTPEQIRSQLATLPVVPHRLEPTLLERQILVLDNGYNSNPSSAVQALEVLSQLEGSQKIVCTPGFVELGKDQEHYNEVFGTQIAKVADLVLLMQGVNTTALRDGLKKAKFPEDSIIVAATEVEGMNKISSCLKPNAVILFENSIPELYQRSTD
ncbi:UDP-N-acetylmuramoyl-tripeptide--D-alanyl-D-alanine ligase [Candidatus Woesebacteria bacterium]|nr:UDP-N-acetylmuramoyl-tripeptide--D-alanyl-D-alanine ligase [Candidatus Woesebacteria bacterium]